MELPEKTPTAASTRSYGRQIDEDSWTPTTYDRISEWGHHPPQVVSSRRDKQ